MIIRRMQATFGKLDGDVLTPAPGLNVICLPNEAGKTTWGAFLTAMLYGVDTRERSTKDALAVKDRCRPWSGKPMEGTMEITWQGRNITLQRQSKGRVPMGVFRAWDTDTGEEIPAITGENCGKMLLGVEKSVFIRSAFIGQGAMAVTRDAGLEQRLSSLVTTGDETVSFTKTADALRQWKNHVRHNRTGHLPETETQLAAVEDKLQTIRAYHRQDLELYTEMDTLTAKKQRLSHIEACLTAADARQKRQQLEETEARLREAEEALAAAREKTAPLPSPEALSLLRRQLEALKTAPGETAPTAPEAPALPPALQHLTPTQLQEKAAEDAALLRQQQEEKPLPPLHWAAAAIAALGLGLTLISPWCALLLVPALILFVLHLWGTKARSTQREENARQTEQLLALWQADSADAVLLAAARHAEALRRYDEAHAAFEAAQRAQAAAKQAREDATAQLLGAVRAFAANIYTVSDAENALIAAENAHREAAAAEEALGHRRATLEAVRAAVGSLPATENAPTEDFSATHSLPQVRRELMLTEQALSETATRLAVHRGQVQALGDPAMLEAQRQQLLEKKALLTQRYDALTLAMETLAAANDRLRSQFSPQLTQVTAELFSAMTGGKYTDLRLPEDLSMEVREEGEAVTREQAYLSGGTLDQLYLALRLAVCRLALDRDVPLVLDDALVYFDEDRLAQAMTLLEQEAETRQILLFTCRG